MAGIVFLAILVIIAVVLMYNSLVQSRVRCDSAWSDIDVQLKRRHDLVTNLVETVRGYAAHEKGTFEKHLQVPVEGDAGRHAAGDLHGPRQIRGRRAV